MIQDTINELKAGITKAQQNLKNELAKVRTGRANAALLDSVKVDYYGSPTPLKQLASVSVPEARMILVKPFEKTQLGAIERAIIEGQLGVNPSNDGEQIRVPMPPLTEERRKDLVKVAKSKGEDCKIAIRKARHDAKDMVEALQKDKEISEDESKSAMKSVEETVKSGVTEVDALVEKKEKEILEV